MPAAFELRCRNGSAGPCLIRAAPGRHSVPAIQSCDALYALETQDPRDDSRNEEPSRNSREDDERPIERRSLPTRVKRSKDGAQGPREPLGRVSDLSRVRAEEVKAGPARPQA